MVFYTKNGIMAALHLKYCSIFPPETYCFNVWISKNKHVHLSILKLNQEKLGKYEKLDEIREIANCVYKDLSDNDYDFNDVYNLNVREITRDFYSADFIVLYGEKL